MTPPIPPSHARYELLRQLGPGGPLTRTFLAVRRAPGRAGEPCVLDLLHEQLARDEDLRALFLDQAAATLSQHHPLLPRALDVIVDGDGCGLAIEAIGGETLASVIDRLGRLRLPVDIHLHVLCQVLEALAAAHRLSASQGQRLAAAHRDVCPRNVLLTHDGQVRLLGNGLGAVSRAAQLKWQRPWVDVRYAAPETLLGAAPEPSADVFSAAVMIWEAIARQPRIGTTDENAVIERRITGNEPSIESVWPDAPQPLVDICERALAHDPGARQSAEQLRAELRAHLARSGEPSQTVLARVPALLDRAFEGERRELERSLEESLRAPASGPRRGARLPSDDGAWNDQTPNASAGSGREPEPPASSREPDTGGHRAFATTLEPEPPGGAAWAAARQLLAPLLLLGALAAAVVFLRGEPRGAQGTAAAPPASARVGAAQGERGGGVGAARVAAAPSAAADAGALDAVIAAEPTSAPAFLEGLSRGEPPHEGEAPTIAAEDLPRVDAERDSLQDAILRGSKARRAAARRKRLRHASARATPLDPAPAPRLPASSPQRAEAALPLAPDAHGPRAPGAAREILDEDPYAPGTRSR